LSVSAADCVIDTESLFAVQFNGSFATVSANKRHWLLLGGSFNDTALWHIAMPVEEPSTASQAVIAMSVEEPSSASGKPPRINPVLGTMMTEWVKRVYVHVR
jgi:hypothetical protein